MAVIMEIKKKPARIPLGTSRALWQHCDWLLQGLAYLVVRLLHVSTIYQHGDSRQPPPSSVQDVEVRLQQLRHANDFWKLHVTISSKLWFVVRIVGSFFFTYIIGWSGCYLLGCQKLTCLLREDYLDFKAKVKCCTLYIVILYVAHTSAGYGLHAVAVD